MHRSQTEGTLLVGPIKNNQNSNPKNTQHTFASTSSMFRSQSQRVLTHHNTIASDGNSTPFQTMRIEEEPEQRPEDIIARELSSRFSLEQRVYLIVNKKTGEVYDSRNEQIVANLLKGSATQVRGSTWNSYWKNITNVQEKFLQTASRGDPYQLEDLLNNNNLPLDVNLKGFDAWTALHFATFSGSVRCVQLLLKYKADPNQLTKFGWNALHIAAKQNRVQCARFLVKQADINAQDEDFCTPLHYACEGGYLDMVRLLLDQNPDLSIRNFQGNTAKECCQNISVYNLFKKEDNNYNDTSAYSKEVFGGVLLQSSRSDHIMRLLSFKKPNQKNFLETDKKDKVKKGSVKFNNLIKMYTALDLRANMDLKVTDFTYYKLLGKGSFGEVYLVKKNSQQKLYAMKVLKKDRIVGTTLARYIQTEREVLNLLNHPFIVKLHYAFQTESRLFLVMQYCAGGDLSNVIDKHKKLSEEVARLYIAEIVLGLEALHKNMIIYRDMKPENLVIDGQGHVLITDFGLSKKGDINVINSSFCGTPAYLPPEILDKKGHNRMADWYELGVVLYELLVGLPPFYAPTREQLYKNKRQNILKIPKGLSDECKDLLKKLLARDPNRRLGIENDGVSVRAHPWFRDIDWQKVYERKLQMPKPEVKAHLGNPINVRFPDAGTKPEIKKDLPNWTFFG